DLDALVSEIVMYLLFKPGKLFSGWPVGSPLDARFKRSVRNAVLNLVDKRKRRYRSTIPIDQAAITAPQRDEQLEIEDFRTFLAERFGRKMAQMFDRKLA